MGLGTYFGATRFGSASNPAIDISGSGRGCNSTAGTFDLKELSLLNGNVVGYRGAFIQQCEQAGGRTAGINFKITFPRLICGSPSLS